MKLKNPCKYSFEALYIAANEIKNPNNLLSQQDRNNEVKRLCEKTGWYWVEVVGTDGKKYYAFSPEIE